jgi:hypothetical protein
LKLCGKDLSFSVAEGIRRDGASRFECRASTKECAFVVCVGGFQLARSAVGRLARFGADYRCLNFYESFPMKPERGKKTTTGLYR